MLSEYQKNKLIQELSFSAVRSSGPGGQNVNKVSSKIELRFHVSASDILNEEQIITLLSKLKSKLTIENELIITVQTSRSQLKNKEEAIAKFFQLIERALKPVKKRKPTKPTVTSLLKKAENKKQQSQKKLLRRKPEI